jgi:hypothetical protein
MKKTAGTLVLALALAVFGCAGVGNTPAVTGELLDAAGRQFVAVGTLYNQLLDQHVITPEQYKPWAAFAKHFKPAFPVAVAAWGAARAVGDQIAQDNTAAAIAAMTAELARLSALAYGYLAPARTSCGPGCWRSGEFDFASAEV